MTFKEIVDAVLYDRFSDSLRASAKLWVNYRAGRLWNAQPWTFKLQRNTLAVPYNTTSVSRALVGDIVSLRDSTIGPMSYFVKPSRPEDFLEETTTTALRPYSYTVIGDNIVFSAPMDMARTFDVLSQKTWTDLSADDSVPGFPPEFHYALVFAGAAEGLKKEKDPSFQEAEQDFAAAIEDMKAQYLTAITIYSDAYPAWP